MGVLGAAGYTPEQLEIELNWIDEHIDSKPYGVDLIVPNSMANKDESMSRDDLGSLVPGEHKAFAASCWLSMTLTRVGCTKRKQRLRRIPR